ncbi:PIN domain-containing protein [Jannaschia sp.]|nr:PIN domain-containing protein [Jannaschia sp.]
MFANRFTALLDANVLVPALERNIILSLAEADLFRPRWSKPILAETSSAICRILNDAQRPDAEAAADRAVVNMRLSFPDAEVEGFEGLMAAFSDLPDPKDRHVIAAAVETRATVIVTDNLRDFPSHITARHGIEAQTGDAFIANAIDLDPRIAQRALVKMLERLRNPVLDIATIVSKLESRGRLLSADQILRLID